MGNLTDLVPIGILYNKEDHPFIYKILKAFFPDYAEEKDQSKISICKPIEQTFSQAQDNTTRFKERIEDFIPSQDAHFGLLPVSFYIQQVRYGERHWVRKESTLLDIY